MEGKDKMRNEVGIVMLLLALAYGEKLVGTKTKKQMKREKSANDDLSTDIFHIVFFSNLFRFFSLSLSFKVARDEKIGLRSSERI